MIAEPRAFRFSAAVAALLAAALSVTGAERRKEPALVELRGRIVCVAEEMHRLHAAELPTRHDHQWSLKTTNGNLYALLRGKFSEAIFLDERLRQKELLVKARLFPDTQVIELTGIRSVKNGVVQDLYYYCEVCAIQSVSPEICACCREPVELIEKPLKDSAPDR